ncbi:hypothetical protein PM082_002319 [Marasmius tenuissimus]|nr:hypothetical protein PM082_002319 [Marasmius tenuissimus]
MTSLSGMPSIKEKLSDQLMLFQQGSSILTKGYHELVLLFVNAYSKVKMASEEDSGDIMDSYLSVQSVIVDPIATLSVGFPSDWCS